MNISLYFPIGIVAVCFIVLYLLRPFNIFSPLRIYRRYEPINSEVAPITLLQYRRHRGRRSKADLYRVMKKNGLSRGEEIEMSVLRNHLKLPPAMSLQCEIRPGVVAVIHAGYSSEFHQTEERPELSFGEYDLYVCIPIEYSHIRNVHVSRQKLSATR